VDQLPDLTGPRPPAPVAARPIFSGPAGRALELLSLSRGQAALDLSLTLLVALVVPFGLHLAVLLVADGDPSGTLDWAAPVHKWLDALLLVGLAAYFVYRHNLPAAAFGMRADRPVRQALWAIPTLGAVYAAFITMMVVVGVLILLCPELQQDLEQRIRFMKLLPLEDWSFTVLLMVPVAIHEEMLFRGLLIPLLRRVGCGWIGAVLLSSAIFALLHVTQGWLGVIQIFGVGAALGLFFVLSRSLLAVMIAHLLFNLFQLQLMRLLFPWLENLSGSS